MDIDMRSVPGLKIFRHLDRNINAAYLKHSCQRVDSD